MSVQFVDESTSPRTCFYLNFKYTKWVKQLTVTNDRTKNLDHGGSFTPKNEKRTVKIFLCFMVLLLPEKVRREKSC